MISRTLLLILLLGIFACTEQKEEKDLVVLELMDFNLAAQPEIGRWDERKNLILSVLQKEVLDIITLQGIDVEQMAFIEANLLNVYGLVYRSEEANPSKGMATPILYNKNKWELVKGKTIWLSEYPKQEGAKAYKDSVSRIYTWARLKKKNGTKEVVVYNTDMRGVSPMTRYLSTRQMVMESVDKGHRPLIMTGYFGVNLENKSMKYMLKNGFVNFKPVFPVNNYPPTFHQGQPERSEQLKWGDYIFVQPTVEILKSQRILYHQNEKYPSGHFPIYIKVKI
ncbi:hypothetical protein [Algivirga pacifica]|uniref:Endonuclease/exonuclease/phosphatase family protein n=1 Tax=Algivirga pacifica TaxID=1162670 RepID=A0ABP9DNF2_9BACT